MVLAHRLWSIQPFMPNSNIFISITMAAATELQEILRDCIYIILFLSKCVCVVIQRAALSVNFSELFCLLDWLERGWTIGSAGPWLGQTKKWDREQGIKIKNDPELLGLGLWPSLSTQHILKLSWTSAKPLRYLIVAYWLDCRTVKSKSWIYSCV